MNQNPKFLDATKVASDHHNIPLMHETNKEEELVFRWKFRTFIVCEICNWAWGEGRASKVRTSF